MTVSWAGVPLAERRSARRERLLDAALELLGTGGSPAVTVRAVCRGAGLTERYFYEAFDDRGALLAATYDHVAAEAAAALAAAVRGASRDDRVRAAVAAFVALVVDDRRKGRVLLVEAAREPVLAARGAASLPAFTALIRGQLPAGADRSAVAVATVGALTALFASWLDGSLRISRARLVDRAVATIEVLARS